MTAYSGFLGMELTLSISFNETTGSFGYFRCPVIFKISAARDDKDTSAWELKYKKIQGQGFI